MDALMTCDVVRSFAAVKIAFLNGDQSIVVYTDHQR